ncbi:MAG: histidine phosphatase family protein [Propionibacteriaceae bacterium]|jgi:probable phosphoglycerate mutase|nr:histidine phosphatase family protein [Propionibacteriaceae bacterium]
MAAAEAAVTRLVLWRHGVTDWNAAGRFQGQTDIPLNATGVWQAEVSAPVLGARFAPAALYSSPSQRAIRTAQALAELVGLPITTREALLEIDVGSWAGMTVAEAEVLDPEFTRAQAAGVDYRRSPDGETFAETGIRVARELEAIAAAHRGEQVVVVGHGGAHRMGIGTLLGWSYQQARALSGMMNCAWSVIVLRGSAWRLESYNNCVVTGGVGPSQAY